MLEQAQRVAVERLDTILDPANALIQRIYEVEDGRQAMDDLALQALKNERVALKDQIAERLRKAGG
nr:DUF465 domain-containing protein [Pseudomonas sp. UBA6718]